MTNDTESSRVARVLQRLNHEQADVEARIAAACCQTTGLPGESGVTLAQHVERITRVVLAARRKGNVSWTNL